MNLIAEIIKDLLCLGIFVWIIKDPSVSNWWVIVPLIGLFSKFSYAKTN